MKELKKILQSLKIRNKVKKKLCFFLGNTKKLETKGYYITPIRENRNFIFFGAVVFNDFVTKKILKIIDGKVDIILIDIEKKIKSKNKKVRLVNIERSAKDVVKKTKIYVYKANDLAVNAAETLLYNIFLNDKRGLGGKKILILGIGNIGFKIALKFVESGSIVSVYRRQKKLLNNFVKTINQIKPQGTISKVNVLNKYPPIFKNYDVVLTTADRTNIVSIKNLEGITKKTILIDVGKGNFSNESINYLRSKKIDVYRLDTTSSYFSYLDNVFFTYNQYNKISYIKKIKNYRFISQGIAGQKDDIILDDLTSPKKIIGICNGNGGLNKHNLREKKLILKKIKKTFKINLSYD